MTRIMNSSDIATSGMVILLVRTRASVSCSDDKVERNVALMQVGIPGDLWAELKREGLMPADAPVPA